MNLQTTITSSIQIKKTKTHNFKQQIANLTN